MDTVQKKKTKKRPQYGETLHPYAAENYDYAGIFKKNC